MISDRFDITTAVGDLVVKQALHELLMRYCRGIDRRDADLIASVFHPDADDDHGLYRGDPEGFVSWVLERQNHFSTTMHCILNEYFEVNGDVAIGEAYFATYATTDEEVHPLSFSNAEADETDESRETILLPPQVGSTITFFTSGGRYLDRFECRDGKWLIARRQVIMEWGRSFATSERPHPAFPMASCDRSDPSYGVFASLKSGMDP